MSIVRKSNPTRNEALASEILKTARIVWERTQFGSGNATHGFSVRFRNRLVRDAGYEYNEAFCAINSIMYGK